MGTHGSTYLILEHPRLALSDERVLNRICYTFGNGFFIQEMHFTLRWMYVYVYRLRIDLQAAGVFEFKEPSDET